MVPMINAQTGTLMYVHPDRLQEYLRRGHKLASAPEKPAPAEPVKRPPAKKKRTEKE